MSEEAIAGSPPPIYPITFGDTSASLGDHHRAAAQDINLGQPAGARTLIGDALALLDHASGGNDTLTSFAAGSTSIIGDAETVTGHAHGGDDQIVGGGPGSAYGVGDALTLSGHAVGGDDQIDIRSAFNAQAIGDAVEMTDFARGGQDSLTGTNAHGRAELYGDAQAMSGHARGGDDTLAASDGYPAVMYGDAGEMTDHASGGDDVLISGSGADQMWGDAAQVGPGVHTGADTFVFTPQNGHDQIMDFEPGKDRIELNGFGFSGFQDLSSLLQDTEGGVLISFDTSNDIFVKGITSAQLRAGDFLFG